MLWYQSPKLAKYYKNKSKLHKIAFGDPTGSRLMKNKQTQCALSEGFQHVSNADEETKQKKTKNMDFVQNQ